jgi:hypothetical protein
MIAADRVPRLIMARTQSRGQAVFEHILAELGDADAVSTLVRAYAAAGRRFDGLLQNAIREAALSKEPAADWAGAYELRPVPLPELRKTLFAMTGDASSAGSESGPPGDVLMSVSCGLVMAGERPSP